MHREIQKSRTTYVFTIEVVSGALNSSTLARILMRRNALASVFHAWRNCLWVFMFHTHHARKQTLHTHSTPHITYLDWHHFALKCTESSSPAHKGSRIPKSFLDRPSPSKSSFSCNSDNCRCISSLCKHTSTCTVHTCIHSTHRTHRHTQQHTQQ